MTRRRVVLVIAGSDSSAGAGIAADIRALHDAGCDARLAITAVTAQTDAGVAHVHPVPLDALRAQLDAVGAIDAVKIGMLVDAERVAVVRDWVATRPGVPAVLDPVIRSSSGGTLLDDDGVDALWDLLHHVALATPNQVEAQALAGDAPWEDWAEAAPCAVLVTGGDADGDEVIDVLFHGEECVEYAHPRVPGAFRGTGCALASRIAAALAGGTPLEEAVGVAIEGLEVALRARAT